MNDDDTTGRPMLAVGPYRSLFADVVPTPEPMPDTVRERLRAKVRKPGWGSLVLDDDE